jgi:DNA-binding transcriptional LysR family regulator
VELRQLQHFLGVVDAGSVADAARKLRMSQPALSLSIRSLERSLGAHLFTRSSSGMTLTATGRALEAHARTIINETARAEHEIHALLGSERGTVAVAASPSFAAYVMPQAVSRFRETFPGIAVDVTEGYFDRLVPGVLTGDYECAFSGTARHYTIPSTLDREVLMSPHWALVMAAPGHPLTSRRRVTPREAFEAQWVMPRRSDVVRSRLADLFARHDLPMPSPAVECNSATMTKNVLRRGGHIGIVTELSMVEELEEGVLSEVRVPELCWQFEGAVMYRKTVPLTPTARKFIDAVAGVCKELATRKKQLA